jgi:hypothetical protein
MTANSDSLYLNGNLIERVNQFTYLGSIIDESGSTEADVATRLQKAHMAFRSLQKIWIWGAYFIGKKLRLFNSNVNPDLLYVCETCKVSKTITKQLQVLINKCLRRVLRIFWPVQMSNYDLWTRSKQIRIALKIRCRKWGWLGHTLRKPPNEIL